MRMRIEQGKPLNLNDQLNAISKGLLPEPLKFPTPTTQEKEHHNMKITKTGRRKSRDGKNSHSINLADTVRIWPTPRAGNPGSRPNGKGGKILEEEAKKSMPQICGQLNPNWVEALMGYPHGWTDINKDNVSMVNVYPGAWLNGTWEDDIPRVVSGMNAKMRIDRLKGLGNAVVPQIPMFIWILIKECL